MSTQITPSAAGSHLPPDSRERQHPLPRRPASEPPAAADTDKADISQASFTEREHDGGGEVANAISFTQTQQGFLQSVAKALDRMGELSVLCQDTTKSDAERVHYTVEFTQLQDFISEIGAKKFNGVNLFSGSTFSIPLKEADLHLPIDPVDLAAPEPKGGLGDAFHYSSADVNTHASAATALMRIRKAVRNLAEMQGKVDSNLRRLSLTTEQMSVLTENLSAANNRINDIGLAKSMAQGVRHKILGQAGTALSAQANAAPQAAIRLLQ